MESNEPTPDISVVVPTRNRLALLRRLLGYLDSIDDGLCYEVIVVDEASSDGTAEWLAGPHVTHHRLQVLRHEVPRGPSAARNAGLLAATGAYVAFIDDDDLTSPERLRRQLRLIEASGARWSCAGKVDIDDDLRVIGHGRCPSTDRFLERLLAFNVLPAAGQGLLIETELARSVGGFDEALDSAEDWDLCIRLAELSTPAFLDEPGVGYRTGVASLSTDTSKMEAAIRAVLAKHAATRARLGVQPAWWEIHRSLLAADLLTSRRRSARRALAALRAGPSPRELVRCAVTLIAPRAMAGRQMERRIAQVPTEWRDAAEAWLHPAHGS
ncbi:MAG: glycosyl transferase [Acidimicrobiaceae bacterium]|nr:MAG: glycosyl transferase [Acidimicrobiaceae bacterium]